MKNIKKFIISISIFTIVYLIPNFTSAQFSLSQPFPYSWIDITPGALETDFPEILDPHNEGWSNWFQQLLSIFMPNSAMYDSGDWPSFIFYLKTVVNLLLWFVTFIALILIIYAFYMIFFKKDEAGITTAKQVIKWVIIALLIIWFSWIIVSFLYRFEDENTQNIWYNNNSTEITTSLT